MVRACENEIKVRRSFDGFAGMIIENRFTRYQSHKEEKMPLL
jgi:hypothetical protein